MPHYIRTTTVFCLLLLAGCAQQPATQAQNESSAPPSELTQASTANHERNTGENASRKRTVIFSSPDRDSMAPNRDIWQRIRKGLALQSYYDHPGIAKQVDWYSGNQTYIDRVMGRAELYLYHIVEQLEHHNMPLELALLPVVESAYDPFAYSNSHASGLWQFIPSTGSHFGLRRDWWYDGRRDPVASTEAAVEYLQYLYNYFDHDWLLALAAYNCGEGNVRRAMAKNRRHGKKTDFWSLKLPRETRAYVPQLLAISRVVANPKAHRVALPAIGNAPYFDIVDVPDQLDLSKAAQLASVDSEELRRLNAGYSRFVTHPEGPHRILMPVAQTQAFKLALSQTPKSQWAPIKHHIVKAGDTLSGIASKHRVTVSQLRKQNRLSSDLLRIGQRIKIPDSGIDSPLAAESRSYRVRRGDSLWKIARQHDVSVRDLAKWNSLNVREPLRPGQVLSVQVSGQSSVQRKVRYKVRRGDSFYRIASKFDLSVNEILEWNNLSVKHLLKPGQRLTLFVDVLKI